MKCPKLGDYLLWEGKPAQIIAESSEREVVIEMLEDSRCPHCGEIIGKEQHHIIVASPLFQNNAEQMPTFIDDEKLILR